MAAYIDPVALVVDGLGKTPMAPLASKTMGWTSVWASNSYAAVKPAGPAPMMRALRLNDIMMAPSGAPEDYSLAAWPIHATAPAFVPKSAVSKVLRSSCNRR
jgi:hypothetical protein